MSSTVADLYDPADVAFKPGDAGPRLMCAACGKREVGTYEPVCPECRKSLEQAGILKPNDQQRVPVGPLVNAAIDAAKGEKNGA